MREAITLIGERMTRRWALVVALAGGGPRPDELLTDALVRARTMELVAADLPGLNADHAFTVGLFSMLPSLVNRPMEQVVGGLGLPSDIETPCSTAARPTARCWTAWSATSAATSCAAKVPRASIASTRPIAPRWRGSSRCARKSQRGAAER